MITIWTTMLSIFSRVIIARNTYTTEHPELEMNKCYLNYCLKVRKKAMEDISSFLHKYPKKQTKKGLKTLIQGCKEPALFKCDVLAIALLRIENSTSFLPSFLSLPQNLDKNTNSIHIQIL